MVSREETKVVSGKLLPAPKGLSDFNSRAISKEAKQIRKASERTSRLDMVKTVLDNPVIEMAAWTIFCDILLNQVQGPGEAARPPIWHYIFPPFGVQDIPGIVSNKYAVEELGLPLLFGAGVAAIVAKQMGSTGVASLFGQGIPAAAGAATTIAGLLIPK